MNNNTTSTVTGTTSNINFCGSRLPCGLCLITNRPCPKMNTTYEPSWTANTPQVTTTIEAPQEKFWTTVGTTELAR